MADQPTRTDWKQPLFSFFVFLLVLIALAFFFWFLLRQIARLESNVAAASIGATATVLVSALAIFVGRYFERRMELEVATREKRIPLYEKFIEFWFRQLYAERLGEEPVSPEEMTRVMVDFTRDATFWASDSVILKWREVRMRFVLLEALREALSEAGAEPDDAATIEPLFVFEEFLIALRRDTGYPNTRLGKGDILGMFIDDIGRYLVPTARQSEEEG